AWVLRDAGFTVSTELPQRALRRRCRPSFQVAEAADPSKRDREVATWHGPGGLARRDAGDVGAGRRGDRGCWRARRGGGPRGPRGRSRLVAGTSRRRATRSR